MAAINASIIGAAMGAEEIQIWTDVDGILTTDPRIAPEAAKVKVISFAEASELAYFGAKVLHPSTLLPAMSRGIPVRVCNSRRPEVAGTAIVSSAPPSEMLTVLVLARSLPSLEKISVVQERSNLSCRLRSTFCLAMPVSPFAN